LREAFAHHGHKNVAEAAGFESSNLSRILNGDQTTSLKRFCAMIDAAGLRLVEATDEVVDPNRYKQLSVWAIEAIKNEAGL